jgi:hypothetical protein
MNHAIAIADAPSTAESRAELERILAGSAFANSPKLAAFLRFVVEASLAGRSDRLKGYTIAVGALGRRADFDPETDAIVRVDAGRVRRALARHYETEGAADPVVIDLPRRHYAPTFTHRAQQSPAASTPAQGDIPTQSDRPRPTAAAAEMCLLLLQSIAFNQVALEAEIASIREKLNH